MATQLTPDQKTALANEVRRQAAALRVEGIKGHIAALGQAAQVLSSLSQDASKVYAVANQELLALQTGAGPGLTADYGALSLVDQLLRKERYAGKSAAVDYVKANPTCTEPDACKAWADAATKATGLTKPLLDPAQIAQAYRSTLKAQNKAKDVSWEAHRAWIVATPKEQIMGM